MSKPTVLTLRIPAGLKDRITVLAVQQGVSINQFAMYLLTTKVTELETTAYFEKVVGGRNSEEIRAEFEYVMAKLRQRATLDNVPAWDEMPAEE